ncbi:Catalytic LigB subunit of aromatic ring-opening dioxygenase [Phytophthora infestans]|uniref:Catalytic LigB subunit of aromatic ring-opening dioxygenase n=1 Tax=Phytophthora infestans TaxID=4787 RepID=A0A8S9UFC4_PHYIN|nr:Catalytic LigB subunit of aromatic ring-opening dioxygenase [Phytophthora infestans]
MRRDSRPAVELLSSIFGKLYPKDENLPKRILFVSAHFESNSYGFEIAHPDMEQLENNKIKAKLVYRGYDHGVFVPMKLILPQADIPIVTMSINSYLTNQDHFNLGKTVTSFRDEDTLIPCSGQSTHNLRDSKLSVEERTKQITNWRNAPVAKYAHPSPDHFMTFVVAAGAGMEDKEPGARALFGGWALDHMSFANYA